VALIHEIAKRGMEETHDNLKRLRIRPTPSSGQGVRDPQLHASETAGDQQSTSTPIADLVRLVDARAFFGRFNGLELLASDGVVRSACSRMRLAEHGVYTAAATVRSTDETVA
jgi:hypothetical protein